VTRSPPRALYAAGLLTVLLGALLVAWFVSGWADVRGRQRTVRDAPKLAAEQRGAELAHELRGELGALMSREVERPYFHYQNLFHDPRASAGPSVAPSPLAQGPDDALVLGYFQLDAEGRTTTPTVNDELPELSESKHLADNRRFRDEVTRSLAEVLAPHSAGPLVAALTPHDAGRPVVALTPHNAGPPVAALAPPPRAVPTNPPQQPRRVPPVEQPGLQEQVQQQAQVVTIDPDTYVQNNWSNSVYRTQQRAQPQQAQPQQAQPQQAVQQARSQQALHPQQAIHQQADREPSGQDHTPPAPDHTPPAPVRPPVTAAPSRPRSPGRASLPARSTITEPPRPITITVSPLEWRTLEFAGQPSVVAVRQVETPDGRLAQGFVVDRTALTSWLATHAGDAVAELRTGDNGTTEIAPGWHLEVAANPLALVAAASEAAGVARGFLLRFVGVGVVAILAAWLVVMLVARAERLARERSQFAAAAAHELRTPLAGLQLYGDMLADGLGDPSKMRDYARRMSEEASRLGRVVSNVLGFSQLERGNLSVEPRAGALGEALCELAERAQPALDRAGCVLALDVAPGLSATFDRDALARIVGNLLDNAEKYGRQSGDRTITLAARATGTSVEVIVSDHGPGIAPQARGRLFQPFARGVTADGPAGLGLGLALSQSLARAMGGELAYRPATDGGAAFVLTLDHG
jgi:signal transduction histidine kinase